jgi:signal transduction histidine kinase
LFERSSDQAAVTSALRDESALFAAYRREFVAEKLPGYAKLGSGVAFAINTAFMSLDYVSFPEHFQFFAAMRLGMNALFVGTYFASDRFPRVAAWSICLSLGAAMLAMIFATGGGVSPYFAGLMLLFLGMGVVMPLSGREAAGICGAILLPYLASPWIHGFADWAVFRIYSVFLVSAAAECVASSVYLERMRFKDFKQRRELQEARDHLEEIDRAKSRFTANVHHELRTPLTLTLAPIEGMLGGEFGEISDLQRQYMKTAEANALRLLKLINDLLDLAKLESHELTLHRVPLDTGRLVWELMGGVRPLAERKGIGLVAQCDDGLPMIQADPDAIEKILINLLGNALKFTERGGTISVELEPGGEDGGVLLRVVDSGIGIPPEQLARVFDRFAQVDGSSTRKHQGTGIGLSLCHELVGLHGGRIWAESEGLGHGTRMCVWLPIGETVESEEERALRAVEGDTLSAGRSMTALETAIDIESHRAGDDSSEEPATPGEASPHEGDRRWVATVPWESTPEIVVADDNADIRRLLQHLLGREFRVRLARNGREALDLVRERAPALVVTDVMMPEMSGTELCREIKSSPETRGIPVMLVTSKAERSMKIEGLELGADDYVIKPFHARELSARVRSLVRLRTLQDELEERNQRLEAANLRVESALTELTETQVALVQRERLVVAGELAAGVAHEANNPLNFAANANRALSKSLSGIEDVVSEILGLGSQDDASAQASLEKVRMLCSEKEFDESAENLRELAEITREGLERTTRLIGNLRTFAGPGTTRVETLDARAGLDSTLQLMGHAMREVGIEVVVESDSDLPLPVGDPRALNQVFLNLLKNARDAMNGRKGTIHVNLIAEDEALVVRIRDEGHGIPEEMRETLFEPFFTTKGPSEGSGLGLSISRNILYSQGGDLSLVETSERGTTFEMRLPVPDDD